MLRHLEPDHRYLNKAFKSRAAQPKFKAPIDRQRQEILQRYAADAEGMPKLKGSKLGAKSKVYSNIAKTKKPGKAELTQRGAVF